MMKTNQNKKNRSFKILTKILGVLTLLILLMACESNDEQTATLNVRLTDAPGDFQEVNIDIQGVEVHNELGEQTSGWKPLAIEQGVYNLLELTNGVDTLLATDELPAGKVSQIRLILGSNNTVMIDNTLRALSAPSALQSGLKLNVNADLKAGVTYTILLDFDAARSIVRLPTGAYSLKPVIRLVSNATSGAISGTVIPTLSAPAVFAIVGNDTVASTFTDDTGRFLLRGVAPGTYSVSFNPKAGYTPLQIINVNVTVDNVTNLGEVTIL
jgi:hypothetical protein